MRRAVPNPRRGSPACGVAEKIHGKPPVETEPLGKDAAGRGRAGAMLSLVPGLARKKSAMGRSGQGRGGYDMNRRAELFAGIPAGIAAAPTNAQKEHAAAGSRPSHDLLDAAANGGQPSQTAWNEKSDGPVSSAPPAPAARKARRPPKNGKPIPRYDAFISYAHKDGSGVAARLEDGLVRRGLRVWRDVARLSAGDRISKTIMDALDCSGCVVAVISPAYTKSRYAMIELGGMRGGHHRGRIIPVLYNTRPDDIASKIQMLADIHMKPWDDGNPEPFMDEIAHTIKAANGGGQGPSETPGVAETDRDLIDMAGRGAAETIPTTIGKDTTIDRNRQIRKIKGLLRRKSRVAIIGDKGSGKSVLSRLLYEDLAASEAALLVRCDDFLGVESAEELDRTVVRGLSLVDVARCAASNGTGGMTIILDSLDAAGRNEKTMRAFRRLLEMLWGAGARTVVTVRSYDYKYSPALGTTDWGARYDLGPLTGPKIDAVLKELGSPSVPPALRKLLAVPLNLHLLSLVLERSPRADLSLIKHEINLYDAHWRHYVELAPLNARIRDTLYDTAEAMLKARRTAIPYDPGDREAGEAAQSLNILERTSAGSGMVRYFHHAYLDYAMSRALLERHRPITDYLRADAHNVFLLPTLSITFAMAYEWDPVDFSQIIKEMARADIPHYWKTAAFAALAAVPHGEKCGACLCLKDTLTDNPMLQRHFLMELARQPCASWFPLWGDALVEWSEDSDNYNGAFLIDCLKAAASDARFHVRVFDAAQALAERNKIEYVRKKSVILLAGIDAPGKARWLEDMSTSEDLRVRSGVASNIARLLETDPAVVPAVFCNLYSYNETSDKKTEIGAYGSLRMTSTMAQDNYMIQWGIGKMLPGLINANPPVMLKAVILTAERAQRSAAENPGGDPIAALLDAGGWPPHWGDDQLLGPIKAYVTECSDADFARLVPLMSGTDISEFRNMLIDGMAGRKSAYHADLVALLSDAKMYESYELRRSVRGAIRNIAGLLGGGQAKRILNAIRASNAPRDKTEDETLRSKRARAAFLSELPRAFLSAEDKSIVDEHARPAPEDGPITFGEFHDMPSGEEVEQDPLQAVKELLEGELDRNKKITLLNNMLRLDNAGAVPEPLHSKMEAFLLCGRSDPDPEQDVPAEPGNSMVLVESVRGLAAECMIKILARRKSDALLDAVRDLSEDPINLVRSDIARSLPLLLPDHYDTARTIALSYSRDPDPRVQFYLPAILHAIARKEPATASLMIGNIMDTHSPASHGVTGLLLDLAIALKEPRAAKLLGRIANKGAFAEEVRVGIPFVLKERYLGPAHRGAALNVLYGLLDDPSPKVRHKAAFFTLNGFDDNPDIDNRAYIARIAPHLDRMVARLKAALDMGIAEPLASFLEKFWKEVPETTLAFLEAIAGHGTTATSEASMADRSIGMLAGLLRHHSLYDGEWTRCLDVLDAFAAVGWPAALDLFAEMGRRD